MMTLCAYDEPMQLFHQWMKDSEKLGLKEPMAMALATATKEAAPSVRIVLLKAVTEKDFIFIRTLPAAKEKNY